MALYLLAYARVGCAVCLPAVLVVERARPRDVVHVCTLRARSVTGAQAQARYQRVLRSYDMEYVSYNLIFSLLYLMPGEVLLV